MKLLKFVSAAKVLAVGAVIALTTTNWAAIPCEWTTCQACNKTNGTCNFLMWKDPNPTFCGALYCDNPVKCKSIYQQAYYCSEYWLGFQYRLTTTTYLASSCDNVHLDCY